MSEKEHQDLELESIIKEFSDKPEETEEQENLQPQEPEDDVRIYAAESEEP